MFMVAFSVDAWVLALPFLLAGNIATDLKNGPNLAAVQNIVPSRMRATAAALFFLAATVVGVGVGAPLVGGLSDWAGAQAFGADVSTFLASCPGGRALPGAGEAADAACRAAAASGLKTALSI